jgi:hypothetical protein
VKTIINVVVWTSVVMMLGSPVWAEPQVAEADLATVIAQGEAADGVAVTIDPSGGDGKSTVENKDDNCTWGCLRWGKFCNVDPRGVYKCRRTCERFGQQCE